MLAQKQTNAARFEVRMGLTIPPVSLFDRSPVSTDPRRQLPGQEVKEELPRGMETGAADLPRQPGFQPAG
jgi:hypothetical protein